MDCGCCGYKSKIKDKCPKHHYARVSHFCTNPNCLQILCQNCIKQHKQLHKKLGMPQATIRKIEEVEEHYDTSIKTELEQNINDNTKDSMIKLDPCDVICRYVDQYFYGSAQNKVANLKQQAEVMKSPTGKQFIDLVQRSSNYCVTSDFKNRYFEFLDILLEKAVQDQS